MFQATLLEMMNIGLAVHGGADLNGIDANPVKSAAIVCRW